VDRDTRSKLSKTRGITITVTVCKGSPMGANSQSMDDVELVGLHRAEFGAAKADLETSILAEFLVALLGVLQCSRPLLRISPQSLL